MEMYTAAVQTRVNNAEISIIFPFPLLTGTEISVRKIVYLNSKFKNIKVKFFQTVKTKLLTLVQTRGVRGVWSKAGPCPDFNW